MARAVDADGAQGGAGAHGGLHHNLEGLAGGAYLFAEICQEIGLPAGVVNVLAADREVSELLVRHPGVDKVSFTGSTVEGSKIDSICGDRIARCALELGGKSPGIILDDFDL